MILIGSLTLAASILAGCSSTDGPIPDKNKGTENQTAQTGQEKTSENVQPEQTAGFEEETPVQGLKAKVISVTDGDTIKAEINGQVESVRFLLVDTPETNHPRLGEQPFGQEAKAFTKQMLEGKTVLLEKDVSDRDKYGRLLYYLYVDGKSVQEELLQNGLARVAYVYAPNTKYVDQYYAIQKKAQELGVGIWSVENYTQEDGFHEEVIEGQQPEPDANKQSQSGALPAGECKIKGNISSRGDKIYHMPGQQFYNVTEIDSSKGEQYFCTKEDAEQAGFRPSKR